MFMYRSGWVMVLFSVWWSASVLAGSFTIAPEQISDLREQRSLLDSKVKELGKIGRDIDASRSAMDAGTSAIKRLEVESNQARTSLEKLQVFDRENPGEIPPEKLRAAETRHQKAFQALKQSKESRSNAEDKINNELNVNADIQYSEFLRLKSSFEREVDRVVDEQLQDRIRQIQVGKAVEVTERVACGDDSIPVCKERSKKAAEQKASERGSVVFINSMTEIKNFKLSKEELRSEVQATLSDKVFSNQHMVGETEYETTIKATVMPAISDALRKQMAEGIRTEVYIMVGGKVEMVKNPALKLSVLNLAEEEPEPEPEVIVKRKPKPRQVIVEEEEPEPVVVRRRPAPVPAEPKKPAMPSFSF
jgi:hypothetical protein